MDKVAMIKQAYAYGAAVALQELGYDVNTAQDAGVKLAEDEEGMHPALRALIGAGAGAGGGALLGAGLGAGGAALAQKLQKSNPGYAGYLTSMAQRGAGESPNIAEKMMSHAAIPESLRYSMTNSADPAALREALLGAQAGGAGGAGLGALGGGLYGGLSE